MAGTLFGDEKKLRLKPDTWTRQEREVFSACRSKAINNFEIGALLGACISWMSTRRLRTSHRIGLSGGAALLCGIWRFRGSIYTSADKLLSLDGSAVQKQVANLIVDNFSYDRWLMQLVLKHFIFEKVYVDSASDKPIVRWRYRNFFVAYNQQPQDSRSLIEPDRAKTDLGFKQVPLTVSPGIDVMADPLDCILGGCSDQEDVIHHHPSTASTPTPRAVTRRQKRLQRKHRIHHNQAPSNPKRASKEEGENQFA